MKRTTRKILWGILAGVGLLLVFAAIFVAAYTGFPGKIKETPFQKQVATAGLKSTFRQGIAYHYPGLPPLLEVSGDPYRPSLKKTTTTSKMRSRSCGIKRAREERIMPGRGLDFPSVTSGRRR